MGDMFLFPFIILCRWIRRHDFSEKEWDETLCYHSTGNCVISKAILKWNFKFKFLRRIIQIKLTSNHSTVWLQEEDRNITDLPIGSCYCIVRQTMYFCDSPRWTAAVLFSVSVLSYEPDVLSNRKKSFGSCWDRGVLLHDLSLTSSSLQHSIVTISLLLIIYVTLKVRTFARACYNPETRVCVYN